MVRYRARDRRLFVAALHRKWFARLAEIIGAPELAEDPRFASAAAAGGARRRADSSDRIQTGCAACRRMGNRIRARWPARECGP